jgi:hypothetical protein
MHLRNSGQNPAMLILGIPGANITRPTDLGLSTNDGTTKHRTSPGRKNLQNEKLRKIVRQTAIRSIQQPVILYPTSTGIAQEPSKRDFVIDSLKEYRKQIAIGVAPSINDHANKERAKRIRSGELGFSRLTDLSRSDANKPEFVASARLNRSYQLSDEASYHRGTASREFSMDFGQIDGSHIDYVSHFTTLENNSMPKEGQGSIADPHNIARSGVQTTESPTQTNPLAKSWTKNGHMKQPLQSSQCTATENKADKQLKPSKNLSRLKFGREYTDPGKDVSPSGSQQMVHRHIETWKRKDLVRDRHPQLMASKISNPFSASIVKRLKNEGLPKLIKENVNRSLTGGKSDLEKSRDEEELDRKIFYYRFDRNLTLLENREKIIGHISQQAKSNPRILLTSLLVPERYKRNLEASLSVDAVKESKSSFKPRSNIQEASHLSNGLTSSEKELIARSKLPAREQRRRLKEVSGNLEDIPVVFEMAHVETKEQEEAKYEAGRLHDQRVAARQKQISDKLEAINQHVEEVFMIHNNNKKVSVNGVITITLIDYLSEALKQADKIRRLESTMLGLYNNLQDITFFRMFRMSEACHIFSWCRMAHYAKGTKINHKYKSNLLVLLRGRLSVNDHGPIMYDEEDKIILESYKITSVKDGVYENVCFTLTDGEYLTPNVFRFFNRKVFVNSRVLQIDWSSS